MGNNNAQKTSKPTAGDYYRFVAQKRESIATMALGHLVETSPELTPKEAAALAVGYADAFVEALFGEAGAQKTADLAKLIFGKGQSDKNGTAAK